MKLKIIKYVSWLYEKHIEEDWSTYTKLGKICIYPAWFIHSLLIWFLFPLWIPVYLFETSEVVQLYRKTGKILTSEEQYQLYKQSIINSNIQRNNFLFTKDKMGKYNKKF